MPPGGPGFGGTFQSSSPKRPDDVVIVFVPGMLGQGCRYWGNIKRLAPKGVRVIISQPGPGSSAHDRAREIFYALKGGTVDYGEHHSEAAGHARFGRTYEAGLHEDWDGNRPIHIVAHSLGGVTALKLTHMLQSPGSFAGVPTSGDWVRSLTTLQSPNNGTVAAYALGEHVTGSGRVRPLSFGWFLLRLVHVVEFADLSLVRSLLIDFALDHWNLSWRRGAGAALAFLRTMAGAPSPVYDTTDCAPFDTTMHAAAELAAAHRPHPSTLYFSGVSTWTGARPALRSLVQRPSLRALSAASVNAAHAAAAHRVRRLRGSDRVDLPVFADPPAWEASDGVCPFIAMGPPGVLVRRRCAEPRAEAPQGETPVPRPLAGSESPPPASEHSAPELSKPALVVMVWALLCGVVSPLVWALGTCRNRSSWPARSQSGEVDESSRRAAVLACEPVPDAASPAFLPAPLHVEDPVEATDLAPGHWHVLDLGPVHHCGIVPFPDHPSHQEAFYKWLFAMVRHAEGQVAGL